jgi:hypothetical protein
LSVYRPSIAVFTGPAASPVAYLSIGAVNRPIQMPVAAGETYYFRFTPNAGNPTPAVLAIDARRGPTGSAAPGAWLVPDDTDGYPAAILSQTTDNTVLGYVPFPAGEAGDRLATGEILASDRGDDQDLKLYDGNFDLIAAVPFNISSNPRRLPSLLHRFERLDLPGSLAVVGEADANVRRSHRERPSAARLPGRVLRNDGSTSA